MRDLRETLGAGDFDGALARIDAVSKPGELLYHLERGALLHYAGRYVESNSELLRAEELIDELYTVSVSGRALTYILNDETEAYRGEIHEHRYVHYYRLLNYFALDQPAAAIVEARRLVMKLGQQRDGDLGDDPLLRDDPFLEMVAATALAGAGEWNAAWIASRHARWGYRTWLEQGATEAPGWLDRDFLNYAIHTGIDKSEMTEGNEFDAADWVAAANAIGSDDASVLVLFESGYSRQKKSEHIRLPVFSDEADWGGDDGSLALGAVLADRYHYHQNHQRWNRSNVEISYFIDVAIPVMSKPTRDFGARCRITLVSPSLDPGAATSTRPQPVIETVAVTDLDQLAYRSFKRDEMRILVKTIARSLLKYLAHQQAEKKLGALAGILANIAGAATEKADTRAWLTLPAEIEAASIVLPPGSHRLRLESLDSEGRVAAETLRELTLAPGDVQIISWRPFQ